MNKSIFKILSISLFALAISICANTKAFAFKDVKSTDFAYDTIRYLDEKGIIAGYPDGTYRPNNFVTRAEFSSMAVRALGLIDKPLDTVFEYADVQKDYWAYPYIELASNFDLMKGSPNGYFLPDNNVLRVEVIAVITNALNIIELTPNQAKEYLQEFKDVDEVPSWAILRTAKAKQLDMLFTMPGEEKYLSPMRPATRAEVACFLRAMIEHALVHPNKKIATEPTVIDGHVIDGVYIDKDIAYIPAGTKLPFAVIDCVTSKVNKKKNPDAKLAIKGEAFSARATKNFVTKDNILVIPIGTRFQGVIEDVVSEKTLLRNGKVVLSLNSMIRANTPDEMTAFQAVSEVTPRRKKINLNRLKMDDFLSKCAYNILKGQNVWIHKGQMKDFVILKPVEIDITTNWVAQ